MREITEKFQCLIDAIIKLPEFKKVGYYLKCIKPLPHGGIFESNNPMYFIGQFLPPHRLFNNICSLPQPLLNMIELVSSLIEAYNIQDEEICEYCFRFCENDFDVERAYMVFNKQIMKAKCNDIDIYELAFNLGASNLPYREYFEIVDFKKLIAFFLYILLRSHYRISNLDDIIDCENISSSADKYKLQEVNNAEFFQYGFIHEGLFYFYNIFLDTTILSPQINIPQTIGIIKNINDAKLYMRLDNTLAIPAQNISMYQRRDMEKWRGKTLSFTQNDQIISNERETTIHYDPITGHKILLYIKKETTNYEPLYHINVEQLWNPENLDGYEKILTSYIHGIYSPKLKTFDHIDYSINQYSIADYKAKFSDDLSTGISILKYGERHYKVWCVRGDNLGIDIWKQLVYISLDKHCRSIFLETIKE